MKKQIKNSSHVNALLGEYMGTLEGILLWDIPAELKSKIKLKITELKNTEVTIPYKHNQPC